MSLEVAIPVIVAAFWIGFTLGEWKADRAWGTWLNSKGEQR